MAAALTGWVFAAEANAAEPVSPSPAEATPQATETTDPATDPASQPVAEADADTATQPSVEPAQVAPADPPAPPPPAASANAVSQGAQQEPANAGAALPDPPAPAPVLDETRDQLAAASDPVASSTTGAPKLPLPDPETAEAGSADLVGAASGLATKLGADIRSTGPSPASGPNKAGEPERSEVLSQSADAPLSMPGPGSSGAPSTDRGRPTAPLSFAFELLDSSPLQTGWLDGSGSQHASAGGAGPSGPSGPIRLPGDGTGNFTAPGSSSGGFSFFAFAILLGLLVLVGQALSKRLRSAPAGWRPVPFVALLERPG